MTSEIDRIVTEVFANLHDQLEQALKAKEPQASGAGEVAATSARLAVEYHNRWVELSRAMPDESLFQDAAEMDPGAFNEFVQLGYRLAAAALTSKAAHAVAKKLASQAGVQLDIGLD